METCWLMRNCWLVVVCGVLIILPQNVPAQDLLDDSLSCSLYRSDNGEDVYGFRADQQTAELFARIVALANPAEPLTLMAANVPSVLALIQDGRRLVLYNTDFMYPTNPPPDHALNVLIALAHGVAHHALSHNLSRQNDRMDDELAADEHAGGTLFQMADDHGQALALIRRGDFAPASLDAGLQVQRSNTIWKGWQEMQSSVLPNVPSYQAVPEPTPTAVSDIPEFPWPPPLSSARVRIPLVLEGRSATLSDVAADLEAAFLAAGYGEFSYLAVPQGFALISRLEQTEANGTPLQVPERWSTRVRPYTKFSLQNYLRALFRATPGHFRIIVFIVTPVPFSQSAREIEADEARSWLTWGLDALPRRIAELPVTAETKTTALIYEFVKPTRDDDVTFLKPGALSAVTHLQSSRLWRALGLP